MAILLDSIKLADRILVLRDGTVREEGTHAELMKLRGQYAKLFDLQAAIYR
jgi:ATP-binding cassette, subfamily B, bacterial